MTNPLNLVANALRALKKTTVACVQNVQITTEGVPITQKNVFPAIMDVCATSHIGTESVVIIVFMIIKERAMFAIMGTTPTKNGVIHALSDLVLIIQVAANHVHLGADASMKDNAFLV